MKADGFSASRYLRPEILLYGCLILASGWVAIDELRTTTRFSDLLYLNTTLTKEDSLNPQVVDQIALRADDVISAKECRSDIVRAGLSFVMRDLDVQDSVLRYDEWATAMDRANRYIKHALTCSPADGDLWARLAMVSQAIGENPQQLSDLMSQSVLLSPSELYTLQARFVVWKKATAATLKLSEKSVERDLRTLLNYAGKNDIAQVLGTQNPDLRTYNITSPGSELNSYIVSAWALMPQARQAYLDAIGIKLPAAQ